MKFVLEIQCDGAAFEDDAAFEVGRILNELSIKVAAAGNLESVVLRDLNGNRVGTAEFE